MRMLSPILSDWPWLRREVSPAQMGDVFEDFDNVINSFLRPTYSATNFLPSCDVNETKNHYLISFDMPGVKKEDIKIETQGNELLISGERRREAKEDHGEATLRREKTYGRFERRFSLPTSIDSEKIEAHYENGVLNIVLPKVATAKSRTIQIQTDQGGFLNKFLGSKKDSNVELKDAKVS